VGGGRVNRTVSTADLVAGGSQNIADGTFGGSGAATVGGGFSNSARGSYATVSGGIANITDSSTAAVIGGGYNNSSKANYATVGGGAQNLANGSYATVPGGGFNIASGIYSFASGYGAHALHDGSFVWSDAYSLDPMVSTAANQFLIRARGGVGIGTNNPIQLLHISNAGDALIRIEPQATSRAGQLEIFRGGNAYSWIGPSATNQWHFWTRENIPMVFALNNSEKMRIDSTGNVGIGTANPGAALDVNGATRLGSGAPAIMIKKLTGTTAGSQGSVVNIAHGLDNSKILSIDVMVDYGSNSYIHAGFTNGGGYLFNWANLSGSSSISVENVAGNSANILSKPIRILITYEQ
jgi:hypothetical protein